MSTPSDLIDSSTRRQVFVERLKAEEARKVERFISRMDEQIRERLTRTDMTAISRANMERMVEGIDRDLADTFTEHRREFRGDAQAFAVDEARFSARELGEVLPDFEPSIPAPSQVRSAALSQPFTAEGPSGGKLLTPFLRDLSRSERDRLESAIRSGFFQGETTDQIVRRVRGTQRQNFRDGVLGTTRRSLRAAVHTSIQHMSSVARTEVMRDNEDVVKGYRLVATLDSRTTTICASVDGREFRAGQGPVPPLHPNCRTTMTYVLDKRFAALQRGRTRPAVGERGAQSIPAKETYYDWLKRQPTGFQDEALGPMRARLLRDGNLSSDRFRRLQLDKNFRPLTLERMRDLEPLAFERAGI